MTYQSCYELPLSIFIKCVVDKDPSWLSDNPVADTAAIWDRIISEYGDLIVNQKSGAYNSLAALATKYRTEAMVIEAAVLVLRKIYDESMITVLKSHGFNYKFDFEDYPKYEKDLDRCIGGLKKVYANIRECDKEMSSLLSASGAGNGEPTTKVSFDRDIAMLSKYMGFPIKKDSTTVSEYAAYINLYCAEVELSNSKNGKR